MDFDYEITDETVEIKALSKVVLVHNMEYGEQKTKTGVIIPDDNSKESGIRPRYCYVYSVGSEVDIGVNVGDKILVAHGRWSRGVRIKDFDGASTVVRRVDPKDILLIVEQI